MRLYSCPCCGARVFFDNRDCQCGAALVYDPDADGFAAGAPCANRAAIGCNWQAGPGGLCTSCEMTEMVPDLSWGGSADLWATSEQAKRWVAANLMRFGYFTSADPGPRPRFRLLAEAPGTGGADVTMGHADGVITLSIAEADAAVREMRRQWLGERFRTMIGHVRHEMAHFLFLRLSGLDGFLPEFRGLFGDERADYGAALARHYGWGSQRGAGHLTDYAAVHPHEDWAESAAHLLLLADILDSAIAAGLAGPEGPEPYVAGAAEGIIERAASLAIAINHVNRAGGLADIYPFVLTPETRAKLAFAHRWLASGAQA